MENKKMKKYRFYWEFDDEDIYGRPHFSEIEEEVEAESFEEAIEKLSKILVGLNKETIEFYTEEVENENSIKGRIKKNKINNENL